MSRSCCTGQGHGHLIMKISQNIGEVDTLCIINKIKDKMITSPTAVNCLLIGCLFYCYCLRVMNIKVMWHRSTSLPCRITNKTKYRFRAYFSGF